MKKLEALLAPILSDPLAQARAVDRPIGYVGLDIPLDIQLTSNSFFCHLPWDKTRKTPHADKWLESPFPGWASSILEGWFEGEFDFFEQVVFTRGDDAIQRLYYYICELQSRGVIGGPKPVIFDVATIPRQTSFLHNKLAIKKLLDVLELDEEDLKNGISRANAYREFYYRLGMNRVTPGFIFENIARADLFSHLLPELEHAQLPIYRDYHRLLLTGSMPPDDSFHLAAEQAGWNVVSELHQRSLTRYGVPVESTTLDPVDVVARHISDSTFGPRAFSDRSLRLIEEYKRSQAEAVVLWLTEDDEALAWHVAQQREVLASNGIPALIMTQRRWDGTDGAEAEITQFLQEIEP